MIPISKFHFDEGVAAYGAEAMKEIFIIAVDQDECDHDIELKVISYGMLASGIKTWHVYETCRKCALHRHGHEWPEKRTGSEIMSSTW